MGYDSQKHVGCDTPSSNVCWWANPGPSAQSSDVVLTVCGFLLFAVALVFGQTIWHGFINYDDNLYVYENHALMRGLTTEGIAWALTTTDGNFWHPLTWMSFLLDYQLYGLNPWGYHLTNVLLHTASSILLFLVLFRMTTNLWPSAFVAAVFAIHPLHVESVAWVAERKDVLSGLFFMLTLGAYVGYVRHSLSIIGYSAVIVLFALGLMAKPVGVTLPFVLLLLDYWPLGRITLSATEESAPQQSSSISWRLIIEKIPLLVLAIAFCIVTPLAEGEAVTGLDIIPLSWRIANAPVAYVAYLVKLFFPVGLALPYPHPGNALPAWKIAGSVLLLVGISAAAIAYRRRLPYLFVGWFWYLGMLVPMIGLVQVGEHAMADRYTYLTQIGLYIAVAWGVAEIVASWPRLRSPCAVASAVVVLGLMGCAYCQASYWHDGETLWAHTLVCTSQNAVAHSNLGNVLANRGRLDAAILHFREAVRIKPNDTEHYNNLGIALARNGQLDEAIEQYQKALAINSNDFKGHTNLGAALASQGQLDAAIEHFQKASEIRPDLAGPCYNLGNVLYQQGKTAEAVAQWRKAVRLEPDQLAAVHHLAWVLATCPETSIRNGDEAVDLAKRAEQLTGGREPAILDTLAAAYAEAGRFSEAVEVAERAIGIASVHGNTELANAIRARIKLYLADSPYRDFRKQEHE